MSTSGPPPSVPTRLAVAGVTDVGRQRKHNEDTVLLRPELNLFAVADGMGGHNAGDVASKLVAQGLAAFFEATEGGAAPIELPDEYSRLSPDGRRLAAGVRKANHDVFTISNTHQQHHGMGSTCVAIHLANGWVHIAHVGDSRCYRIRDGQIQQMTRDHSLINDALDLKPDLTKEELARLPKNIITRALGMKDGVKVDVKSEPTLVGDTFLLCSDGLTGMVPTDQILEVIGLTPEPQEACELLIAEANDAGGTDNISAVLVRVEEAIPEPAEDAVLEIEAEAEADQDVVELHDLEQAEIEAAARDHEIAPEGEEEPPPPDVLDDDEGAPTLQIVAQAELEELPLLDERTVAELVTAFARGEPIDLDLRGSWPSRLPVRRCNRCSHELYMGNAFCTECGTPISSTSP